MHVRLENKESLKAQEIGDLIRAYNRSKREEVESEPLNLYLEDEKGKISSTRIRQAILDGDVKEVNHLLGTPLPSRGMVVHGNARGRTIGYPTANLVLRDRTYMPADGVYVVDVEVQRQRYRGMASVGKNVTFDGEEPRFEVNIFDFSDDIYGETVMVYWLDRVRDMVKFDSVEELVDQLQKDEEIARNWKDGESIIQESQV